MNLNGESRRAATSLIWINLQVCEGLGKERNSEQDREAASGVQWPTATWGPGPLWNRCESFHSLTSSGLDQASSKEA